MVQLIAELQTEAKMRPGRMTEIANSTGIPKRTLENWRSHLQKDHTWRPEHGHKGIPRKLDAKIEEAVAAELLEKFVDKQAYCSRTTVLQYLQRAADSAGIGYMNLGRKYVDGFLARNGLSLRAAHLKRRTAPDDTVIAQFVDRMGLVMNQFPPQLVVNVDETCWRLVNGQLKTLARRGSSDVAIPTSCSPKTDITVIAACTLAGDRLPLRILATGTTDKCHDKYVNCPKLRHHFQRKLTIDHSPRGWSTQEVMIRYLSWLKEYCGDRLLHVVWDLHASHRHESVQEWASQHGIGLTYIPAGQTDQWQPLDRRVFGALKRRSLALASLRMAAGELDMYDAIAILVDSWDQVQETEIVAAWSHIT